MKPEWRRFAPIGLWLSLVAAVVSIGLFIVLREWGFPLQISLGLVVIGLAMFGILDPDRVRSALTGRQARYGSNALVLSVAFIGILVVINYLGYQNTKKWDLTEDKSNTLAPETLDVLSKLSDHVIARAFYSPSLSTDTAKTLLDQYVYNSKGKFDYEFVDPVNNPALAKDANVTQDGMVVLFMGDLKEPVDYVTEQGLTDALIRLMNPGQRVVYFLTGEGEFSLEGGGQDTLTSLKTTLEAKNYTVKSLNLLTDGKIPDDARVIVIDGPTKPLSENEVSLISDFLNKGGGLIAMEEPLLLTDFGDNPDPLANYLAQDWGSILGNDIVVDLKTTEAYLAIANSYGNHAITQKMTSLATIFPTSRSVQVSSTVVTGVSQTQLIETAQNSWAETDLDSVKNGNPGFNTGADLQGPVPLAVAAENAVTNGRVVVFGDAEFPLNAYIDAGGNLDMISNTVDWTARQENLINLTSKQATQRMLVTPKTYTIGLLFLGSLILLPGIVLVGGIVAWVLRRRRG